MRYNPKRLIPWLIGAFLMGGLLILPPDSPLWLVMVLGALILLISLVILVDHLIDRWMRRNLGKGSNPKRFFLEQAPVIFIVGSLLLSFLFAIVTIRVIMSDELVDIFLMVSGVCLGVALLVATIRFFPRLESKHPLSNVLESIGPPSLSTDLREALAFQKHCGVRLAGPIIELWLVAFALYLGLGSVAYFVGLLGLNRFDQLLDFDKVSPFMKLFVFVMIGLFSLMILVPILTTFRLVWRMRVRGRLRKYETWREFGLAIEKAGIIGAAGLGFFVTTLLVLSGYAIEGLGHTLASEGILSFPVNYLAAVIPILVVLWLTLIWPLTYLFPVLCHRDCGWMQGAMTSMELVSLERRDSLPRAFLATGMITSLVFLPAGIFLLHVALENRRHLMSAILREKTMKEIQATLMDEASDRPKSLQKYFDLLEKGRYLDALNGFQIQLMKDPQNIHALHGQSIAYLKMGNPRARESVELWVNLDEDNLEAEELLIQLNDGRWSEEGDLFLEAKKNCTQEIGRGL